jgi:hypothetical protein
MNEQGDREKLQAFSKAWDKYQEPLKGRLGCEDRKIVSRMVMEKIGQLVMYRNTFSDMAQLSEAEEKVVGAWAREEQELWNVLYRLREMEDEQC